MYLQLIEELNFVTSLLLWKILQKNYAKKVIKIAVNQSPQISHYYFICNVSYIIQFMFNAQQSTNSPPFSLIKYESQIEISDNLVEYQRAKKNQKSLDSSPSPQDVLNNMMMPRDWKSQNGRHFMQYVSHQKSQRSDIVHLKQALYESLTHKQARLQGICPIKEQLFSQAFDQIIREVTINCPERGLLLMRVRDQHKMTIAAYQTLYQSSISFGMRKLLQAEQGMDDLNQLLQMAQKQKNDNERQKLELLSKKQSLQKKLLQKRTMQKEEKEDQFAQIQQQQSSLSRFFASIKEGSKTQ